MASGTPTGGATVVTFEPGTESRALLDKAVADPEKAVTIRVTPAWTERVFEKGDRVGVQFDDGPGSAWVLDTFEIDGIRHVRVEYGPRRRFTTSLEAASVTTENKVLHPLTVEVLN